MMVCVAAIAMAAYSQTVGSKKVMLETTKGNILLGLYEETPLHRDNFLKMVRLKVYDSLLFHRVIADFMIQAGDPKSKYALPGEELGSGDFDYTVPAEIRLPNIYHKRGALAMAREGEDVNPTMASSACQFYIVWGKTFSTAGIEAQQERLDTLYGGVTLTPEMIETYRWVGGVPHLDGGYTVFGEVIEGLDVVEQIEKADTDDNDRPVWDIRILRATIVDDEEQ